MGTAMGVFTHLWVESWALFPPDEVGGEALLGV